MHDSIPYGPIQGQGHVALKVILPFSKSISSAIFNGSWHINADSCKSKLVGTVDVLLSPNQRRQSSKE